MKIFFLSLLVSSNASKADDYQSSYLTNQVNSKINRSEVRLIIEIGACDCKDSVMLSNYYQCPLIVFECAPKSIIQCKKNIMNYPNIRLVEKAVWEKSGPMIFNYCAQHPGSSSCFPFDFDSLAQVNRDHPILCKISELEKHYKMEPVEVEAVRMDDWLGENNINEIDLVCMDTQGATLPILRSFGKYLQKIKYIITEVAYKPSYKNENLFPKIKLFMEQNGFVCFNYETDSNAFFNDVLFVRKDMLKN